MYLGKRLETLAALVPQGCVLADIGTDHAYLPVWLVEQGRLARALACDVAAGPCRAARLTIAQHGLEQQIEVRQGSGLTVLKPGEADCIAIAGMGAATIISILEEAPGLAEAARLLLLQPMAGAPTLRRWLCEHGWQLTAEALVDEEPHFYELIAARRGESVTYTEAEYAVGPLVLRQRQPLLVRQLERQLDGCAKLLTAMGRSASARESAKYHELQGLQSALEVLRHEYIGNGK